MGKVKDISDGGTTGSEQLLTCCSPVLVPAKNVAWAESHFSCTSPGCLGPCVSITCGRQH